MSRTWAGSGSGKRRTNVPPVTGTRERLLDLKATREEEALRLHESATEILSRLDRDGQEIFINLLVETHHMYRSNRDLADATLRRWVRVYGSDRAE